MLWLSILELVQKIKELTKASQNQPFVQCQKMTQKTMPKHQQNEKVVRMETKK